MRKTLVALVAMLAVAGITTAAVAQTDPATFKASVKPSKAGTKKKPRNVSVAVDIVNNDPKRTLSKIEIQMPKTLTVSGKGLKTCSTSKLANNGPSACPSGSKVGSGTASASLGVNTTSPTPLTFVVTPVVASKNRVNFYLHANEIAVNVVAPGKVKSTSKGPKLTVTVPQAAQQPAPGVFAGLTELKTKLGKKSGSHKLIASTGCKKHKQPFKAKLIFADNGVSPAGTVSVAGSAKCS